jgi:hypothetical protein
MNLSIECSIPIPIFQIVEIDQLYLNQRKCFTDTFRRIREVFQFEITFFREKFKNYVDEYFLLCKCSK